MGNVVLWHLSSICVCFIGEIIPTSIFTLAYKLFLIYFGLPYIPKLMHAIVEFIRLHKWKCGRGVIVKPALNEC